METNLSKFWATLKKLGYFLFQPLVTLAATNNVQPVPILTTFEFSSPRYLVPSFFKKIFQNWENLSWETYSLSLMHHNQWDQMKI